MKSQSNSGMISVRLPAKVLADIEYQVKSGFVMNKADFVRLAVVEKLNNNR